MSTEFILELSRLIGVNFHKVKRSERKKKILEVISIVVAFIVEWKLMEISFFLVCEVKSEEKNIFNLEENWEFIGLKIEH